MKKYGSTSKISGFLVILYYAFILIVLASLVTNVMQLIFLDSIHVSLNDENSLNINNSRMELISRASYFLFIFISFIYVIWKYKSYSNLKALCTSKLEFSPIWAVGIYFIPLYNFWMPYKAMRELSRSSKPGNDSTIDLSVKDQLKSPTPKNIKFWWALVLLSFITGRVARIVSHRVFSLSGLQYYTVLSIFYDMVNIALTIFTILVVREVTKNQDAKFRVLDSSRLEVISS